MRWTLHFALFYDPIKDYKWHCYRDASWALEGDCSHQAVAMIYLGSTLVPWQSQRQSLVALSSAEAELIASVWGKLPCIESLWSVEWDDLVQASLHDLLRQFGCGSTHSTTIGWQDLTKTPLHASIMAPSLGETREYVGAICTYISPESRHSHQRSYCLCA